MTEQPSGSPAPRARQSWHVVEVDEADVGDLEAVVVVMSTHASEQAARNSLTRMRSKRIGNDRVHYEVRAASDIRRRREWDPDQGRGVVRHGPPSLTSRSG